MADITQVNDPALERAQWQLYRTFFDQSERRRRWSIEKDIPWTQCNKNLDPAISDVVESFCAVELYLPDYLIHAIPASHPSRARTWFYANWGYEESKHSLALNDWLLKSGARSEERMTDLEGQIYQFPWQLPFDNYLAMLIYAMVQERATALNYRNLRRQVQEHGGDPALERLLTLLSVDEQAHHRFFLESVQLYLARDRDGTLAQIRRVMLGFAMPAIYGLADGRQRVANIKELEIFNDNLYYQDVYLPILADLGLQRADMRTRTPNRKSAPTSATN
ncbi:MAG TPA: acyl-ACP desaturase [Gemmataceae bacterium]|nr:acyl-ACP desaturase [Gemmataceae bacterium]